MRTLEGNIMPKSLSLLGKPPKIIAKLQDRITLLV